MSEMKRSAQLKTEIDHAIAILENIVTAGQEAGASSDTWDAIYGVTDFLSRISDEVEEL